MSVPSNIPPVKILCLHGYTQTAASFGSKTGSIRKALKELRAEFVYAEAPFEAPSTDGVGQGEWLLIDSVIVC